MLLLHGMLTSRSAYLLFGYCLSLIVSLHGRYTVNLVVFFVDNKLPGTVSCHISSDKEALHDRHFVTGLADC